MNAVRPAAGKRRRTLGLLGLATGAALAAVVVLFVLPSEFGIDPTGFGKASGLTQMANPLANETLERGRKRSNVLSTGQFAPEPGASDHWTYELGPYEEIELKYVLDNNAPMTFAWRADGPLNFDMHAHPFDGGEAVTESYAVARGNGQSGRYVAAFSGIHGWHWQNRSLATVLLTLDASGTIKGSRLIGGPEELDRPLTPGQGTAPAP